MQKMFESATLKLTGWYLLIIMLIGLLFSTLIYQIASSELDTRLTNFSDRVRVVPPSDSSVPRVDYRTLRDNQAAQARQTLIASLVYINIFVLLVGGAGSFLLARRTLRPIKQAHEAQSRFTSDASHELRTPLAAMKTELEVALRDKALTKPEMKELLISNLEEVNKLTRLSQTLLKLSRQDYAGLDHTPVALGNLVRTTVARYDKTGTRIQLHVPKNQLLINAHEPSIEELITILVDNALKYSPEESLVTIRLSKRGSHACFEITNTGKGIDAKDLPHIFDRFYRADNARSGDNGHGLGLSLARIIVEMHHGELTATSAPDHATIFTVLLPMLRKNKAKNQN